MDDLNKIVKKTVEQFEVPYNESHWIEMDGKLNKIAAAKTRKNISVGVVTIAFLTISSYFILSNKQTSFKKDTKAIVNEQTIKPSAENIISPIIKANKSSKIKPAAINKTIAEEKNIEIKKISNNEEIKEPSSSGSESSKINHSVKNTINADFIVYNNKICLGEEVSFEGYDNTIPVYYTWDFGDGTTSHEKRPKHKYKEDNNFTVTLTLLDKKSGKEYTTTQTNIVTILPKPEPNFLYTEESKNYDDNNLKYPYTTFSVETPNEKESYKWIFDNNDISNGRKTKYIFKEAKDYYVSLIAENNHGCVNKRTKKVTIENGSTLYVQNVLKPNSNITENATFIPKALTEWPDIQFEMTITDKSGKTVYKTSDNDKPWNGKFNNTGNLLNEGTYLWQIITYDAEKNPHQQHGRISLKKN